MNITSLPAAGLSPITAPDLRIFGPQKAEGGMLFEEIFASALNMYNETSALSNASEQLYIDLATGKTDDILAVVLAQERSSAAFNFTSQITARIIEAYREIMRIQV